MVSFALLYLILNYSCVSSTKNSYYIDHAYLWRRYCVAITSIYLQPQQTDVV